MYHYPLHARDKHIYYKMYLWLRNMYKRQSDRYFLKWESSFSYLLKKTFFILKIWKMNHNYVVNKWNFLFIFFHSSFAMSYWNDIYAFIHVVILFIRTTIYQWLGQTGSELCDRFLSNANLTLPLPFHVHFKC